MCEPTLIAIGIGAAIGAGTAAVTGQDPLMGALMGGAMGGFNPGFLGVEGVAGAVTVNMAGPIFATGVSLAGNYLLGAMAPQQQQDYNQATTGMPYAPQAYSSQHTKVTGSGGRQAAAVLASEIKQAKSLRKRQAEASADYGLGMDMAGTGLQIA